MRTWAYEVDPSRRIWTLFVENADLTSYKVTETRYDHTLTERVKTDARFIVDALNEKEQREAEDAVYIAKGEVGGFVYGQKWRQYRKADE